MYQTVEAMKADYPGVSIKLLCGLFGKTRQAWYEHLDRQEAKQRDEQIILEIVAIFRKDMPRIGSVKLHHLIQPELIRHDIKCGRDKLHFLLRQKRMIVKIRRRSIRTTFSDVPLPLFANLIEGIEASMPEQIWVADITYIRVGDFFNYLSLITDAYSHRIMGYCLHERLVTDGCLIALEMALANRIYPRIQTIHHSDRGFQYRSAKYLQVLANNSMLSSMTQTGNPRENPVAERINGILKSEFALKKRIDCREGALQRVESAIAVYNSKRPHSSCNFLTPDEAHLKHGPLPKRWKGSEKQILLPYELENEFSQA